MQEDTQRKVFGYHAQIKWFQWVSFGLLSAYTLMAMVESFQVLQQSGTANLAFLRSAASALGAALFTGGYFALFRSLATFEIVVEEHGFSYANFRARGFVRWEDIQQVRGRYIPSIGGWLTIKSAERTLRLTMVFKGIDEFTRVLYTHLNELPAPPFARKNLFGFYKSAVQSTMSFRRWKLGWGRLLLGLAVGLGVAVVTMLYAPSGLHPYYKALVLVYTGLLTPALVMSIAEILVSRKWVESHLDQDGFVRSAISDEDNEKLLLRVLKYMLVAIGVVNALTWLGLYVVGSL